VARVIERPSLTKRATAESRLKELRLGPPEEEGGAGYVWTCQQSPIGVCIYHPPTDKGYYDSCLFCGQPMERK
jgi:hypothetical protein